MTTLRGRHGWIERRVRDGDEADGARPRSTPPEPSLSSGYLGYIDLTTGETSMTQIAPHNSAIDVSPDGDRIAYVAGGVVNVANLDGSNDQVLVEGTRGEPTGQQWSPDGSSIVFQDGPGIGNLYIVDVGSGTVRRITDLEGLETASFDYLSPTFDRPAPP